MANENTYFWLIITLAFVMTVLSGTISSRRRRLPTLRPIPGYEAMPRAVDESIESDRRLHLSPGSAAVGQTSTITAIAATSIIYALTERQSFLNRSPLVTLTDPVTMAMTNDLLRKAYMARENLTAYRSRVVSWFPQGQNSVAFGAGAAIRAKSMDTSSHIMVGEFGPELAFIGEASMRFRQNFVAASTTLEGQAIAYVQSDAPLIGEEIFIGSAYLEPQSATFAGGVVALDALRWALIIAIIIAAIVNA
ncbi:MAG: hypothetical protein BroJett018_43560 [Chloroflexota bacterium]|nr:hypothetical protein [Chloroflexota bacterium]NOG65640.1 hypothetical protein [Chloroflexota bacterium]GIK66562.1 MAG: hypothetical protein BroJett018_43560 [Chloroflexota bacterium]